MHIDACPTPKNKTIDFIRYDGQRLAEPVYEGKFLLKKMDFLYLFLFAAEYCDHHHFNVICEKDGHLMPANLTVWGLIRVS